MELVNNMNEDFEERAAIKEFDAGMSKAQAELEASIECNPTNLEVQQAYNNFKNKHITQSCLKNVQLSR